MKYKLSLLAVQVVVLFSLIGCVSSAIKHELGVEYYNLGNAYYKIQSYEKAIEFFTKSIAQDSDLIHAHYNLSLALIKQGRGAEADKILLELLLEEPQNVSVLQILGYSYFVQRRNKEALAIFDEILELAPEDANALYNIAIILWDQEQTVLLVRRFAHFAIHN